MRNGEQNQSVTWAELNRKVGLNELLSPFEVGRSQQHGRKEIGPFQRYRDRGFAHFRSKVLLPSLPVEKLLC